MEQMVVYHTQLRNAYYDGSYALLMLVHLQVMVVSFVKR